MTNDKSISVVIPVHNGANTIGQLCDEIIEQIGKNSTCEIVLVDDGSKDNSWAQIASIKDKHGDLIVGVRLSKNFGQHNATLCGLSYAKHDLIITMDDDRRHKAENIQALIDCMKQTECDVVYGINANYAGGGARSTASSLLKKSTKYFSQHKFGEGSSFRLFKRTVVDKLKENRGSAIFIDEVIHWYTNRIEIVAIENMETTKSESRYSPFKLFRLYTEVVHNYAVWPLRGMIILGGVSSAFTFILGIYFILKKVVMGVAVPGFTATIVTILFSSSIIILSLGIIGLYIFKLYQMQSGKPTYSVSQII